MSVFLGLILATALGWAAPELSSTSHEGPEGFVAGTLVLTADGPAPVESIQVGDWVVAHDVEQGTWGLKPVVHTFRHQGAGAWPRPELDPSRPRGPPTVGAGQRLWTGDGWRYAGDAGVGSTITTHTFEVADWHTYLVAGERGWTLAHNQQATVTYYRVQGGEGTMASRPLISLNGSAVTIEHTTLNVSTGNLEHARHFLERRPGAKVVAFDVPLRVHQAMVAEAIPQLGYRTNPQNLGKTAPKIVDPTTPGQSYELPKKWAAKFDQAASNGRVLSPDELRSFAPRGPTASPAPAASFDNAQRTAERVFAALKNAGSRPVPAAQLVVDPSPRVDVRADPATQRVHVTTGLLDALATRAGRAPSTHQVEVLRRTLSVVLAHELAHLSGTKAERVADRLAIERLQAAGTVAQAGDLKLALQLFAGGQPTLIERIRAFARYGTVRGRLRAFDAAVGGAPDPLARFRRADGTLRWAPLLGSRMLHESAGAGKFTLGLFVKELTLVLQTGDEDRIGEFFDGITRTDFWVHYGVFAKSARSAELLYGRTLGKYVKNRFANGLLRQNVALAAGLAVPELLHGGLSGFNGKSFMISLGALGISSTAVRIGAQGLNWIKPIKLGASRAAKVGGFLAQVGETALVLYAADRIETWVRPALARRALRAEIVGAATALLEAAARGTSDSELAPLIARHTEAWQAWRDHLFDEVFAQDHAFQTQLEAIAETALELEHQRLETHRLAERPGLRAMIERDFGSLEAFIAQRQQAEEREVGANLERAFEEHTALRGELLERIYAKQRRERALLASWSQGSHTWLGTPHQQRAGGRTLAAALRGASQNRLQTWEDEAAVLAATRALAGERVGEKLAFVEDYVASALELEGKIARGAELSTR